jgi:CheY-like chemotaxis protein
MTPSPELAVLIVDDNAVLRTALRRVLRCRTTFADTVASAAKLLEANAYDVILCDVELQAEPGTDLFASLARIQPELARRVVFMTAGMLRRDLQEQIDAAGQPVLMKPFTAAQAWAAIDQLRRTAHRGPSRATDQP